MANFQAVWMVISHYGYDTLMELFVDFGDHMITHYVVVIVVKAGAVHIGWLAVRRFRRRDKTK